jgi:hypothetical protein
MLSVIRLIVCSIIFVTLSLLTSVSQAQIIERCLLSPAELQRVLGVDSLIVHMTLQEGKKVKFSLVEYDSVSKTVTKVVMPDTMHSLSDEFLNENQGKLLSFKIVYNDESIKVLHEGMKGGAIMGLPPSWQNELMTDFSILSNSMVSLKRMSSFKAGQLLTSNFYLCLRMEVVDR